MDGIEYLTTIKSETQNGLGDEANIVIIVKLAIFVSFYQIWILFGIHLWRCVNIFQPRIELLIDFVSFSFRVSSLICWFSASVNKYFLRFP
jgi:hypothetical protein